MCKAFGAHGFNVKIYVKICNTRSLSPKVYELDCVAKANQADLIECVTETWLSDEIPDTAVLFRNDRPTYAGGIAVYVSSKIPCRRLSVCTLSSNAFRTFSGFKSDPSDFLGLFLLFTVGQFTTLPELARPTTTSFTSTFSLLLTNTCETIRRGLFGLMGTSIRHQQIYP